MLLNRGGGESEDRDGKAGRGAAVAAGPAEQRWGPRPGRSRQESGGFRHWRRSRPFWAGLWTVLAGVELLSIPMAPLGLLIHEGVAGVSGVLMGTFLVILGLSMWLAPKFRGFAGIATLVLAVASLVLSNLGGFLFGFLLGVLGGAMAVSWIPDDGAPRRRSGRRGQGWTKLPTAGGGAATGGEGRPEGDDGNGGPSGPGPDGPGDAEGPRGPGGAPAAREEDAGPNGGERGGRSRRKTDDQGRNELESTLEMPAVTDGLPAESATAPGTGANTAATPAALTTHKNKSLTESGSSPTPRDAGTAAPSAAGTVRPGGTRPVLGSPAEEAQGNSVRGPGRRSVRGRGQRRKGGPVPSTPEGR